MEEITIVDFNQEQGFVESERIKDIIERSSAYLNAGFPVHFRGPAGTGKTTLAMHIANILNQPTVIIFGSDAVGSVDFVGGQFGYHKKVVIDNYIHSVLRTEETAEQKWIDGRLVTACREGYTLIYDEFTRSTPETNNVLLSVLEEKVLELPINRGEENYIKVHPNFKVIFTSNPEKYAGVHNAQEALLDRMVTVNLEHWDRETEIKITIGQSGVSQEDATKIVNLVRAYRSKINPVISIRSDIMLGKVVRQMNLSVSYKDPLFIKVCKDIIDGRSSVENKNASNDLTISAVFDQLLHSVLG